VGEGTLGLIAQRNGGVRHQLKRSVINHHMKQSVIRGRNRTTQACLPWFGVLARGEVLSLFDEVAV
jgi:hypothetical protein